MSFQLRTSKSIRFFDEMFRNKFGFKKYTSLEHPALFFGIYRKDDIDAIKNHKGKRIIWFAGSDSMSRDTLLSLKELQEDSNTVFVAESPWIRRDLDAVGIKYESISLFLDDIYKWRAVPLGKSIFWYSAGSTKYGKQYLDDVKSAFPDIDIITNDAHSIPRDKMQEVYAKCFVGIRPVEHDGTSMSVSEMALMGRMTIYNGEGPFSIPFNNAEDIIKTIKILRETEYNFRLVAKRARSFFIEGEKKWCNLILSLCDLDELDTANIFYEDIKRCGSFYRIVRKEDIERIGGFGNSQMERSWFSGQIIKLGKKHLMTSKHSGFVVNEFKGLGNKGYPKDFKDFNTYDSKYS